MVTNIAIEEGGREQFRNTLRNQIPCIKVVRLDLQVNSVCLLPNGGREGAVIAGGEQSGGQLLDELLRTATEDKQRDLVEVHARCRRTDRATNVLEKRAEASFNTRLALRFRKV